MKLSDSDLQDFLDLLTINNNAPTLEDQYDLILISLDKEFPAKHVLLERLYYANALSVVKELTTQQLDSDRQITKRKFLKQIDQGALVFTALILERFSQEKYVASIRKDFFSTLNIDPFDRYFLIEVAASDSLISLKNLVYAISRTWCKTSKRTDPKFCPKIYLHGLQPIQLAALKATLYAEGMRFRDGYPFRDAEFSVSDYVPEPTEITGVRIDFVNSLDDLTAILSQLGRKKEIYQFHYNGIYFESDRYMMVSLLVQNLSYIEGILK